MARTSPTHIGKYKILDLIGEGGMAEVYRACLSDDSDSGKIFAIKCIKNNLSPDPVVTTMFVDEARLAGQLLHPSIVRLIEFGTTDDGRAFMVMEYIEGRDLHDCLADAALYQYRLPIEFALSVTREILHALAYAHQARSVTGHNLKVVHRDINHSNILLSNEGAVKVVDFGIARSTDRHIKSASGVVKGKLGYLSPEQVRAEELDGRSDIFAAGIVLWELLTQRRMFKEDTEYNTMLAICDPHRVAPSIHRTQTPPELDELCLKAVAARKEDRFQSANDFAQAIDEVSLLHNYRLSRNTIKSVIHKLNELSNKTTGSKSFMHESTQDTR